MEHDGVERSATDRLRRLLDERGVEWTYQDGTVRWRGERHPYRFGAWLGINNEVLTVSAVKVTPEQAVEATLGRGTCRMTLVELRGPAYTDTYECDGCGHQTMVNTVMGESEPPRFCPECGRQVVE